MLTSRHTPGKGDGTFKHPRTFGIEPGLAPQGVAVGDLNGDLHADIITANALSNDITVLRGAYMLSSVLSLVSTKLNTRSLVH